MAKISSRPKIISTMQTSLAPSLRPEKDPVGPKSPKAKPTLPNIPATIPKEFSTDRSRLVKTNTDKI